MAMTGILTKTQSPGAKLKLCGLLMMSCVTFEGRMTPAEMVVLPLPMKDCSSRPSCSRRKMMPGQTIHFQNSGACRMRNAQ